MVFSRLFKRLAQAPEPQSTLIPQLPAWQPLYYPYGLRSPLPCPRGRNYTNLVDHPEHPTVPVLLKEGLEAWLGFHAMRQEGCQTCVQCASSSGALMLEFYSARFSGSGDDHIGAYWFSMDHSGFDPRPLVDWGNDGQLAGGYWATGSATPAYMSLHYRCSDGLIWTRSGNVKKAPLGTTPLDLGTLASPESRANHRSLALYNEFPAVVKEGWAAVDWDSEGIRWSPAIELTSKVPGEMGWMYPEPFRTENRWLQEHP